MIDFLISQFMNLVHVVLHVDAYLQAWSLQLGPWLYLILFLIVFAETGLVVTPFLPGDSLLFAVGALCALGSINITIILPLLFAAALIGDNLNYYVGRAFGQRFFTKEKSRFFNPEYVRTTQAFYAKYGVKAIILARFAPIARTFAPFVAGMGKMHYFLFLKYSVVGALLWINLFTFLGYFFGNLPQIKANFHIVIYTVIFLSILPMLIPLARNYFHKMKS